MKYPMTAKVMSHPIHSMFRHAASPSPQLSNDSVSGEKKTIEATVPLPGNHPRKSISPRTIGLTNVVKNNLTGKIHVSELME